MTQEHRPVHGLDVGCPTGKLTHPTRADAAKVAKRFRLRGEHLRPYPCPLTPGCGGWHIGHIPQAAMRGVRSATSVYQRRNRKRGAA